MYCPSQVGSSDSGLFGLAFSSVIAMGDDPGRYTFEQRKMREHLHRCLFE